MDAQDDPMDSSAMDSSAIQATQPDSQSDVEATGHSHLWGYLNPCSTALAQLDFWEHQREYNFGRAEGSNYRLMGFKVSSNHCTLKWDGSRAAHSIITVYDNSSNGTFINGAKVGKGKSAILKDGQEICFGTLHQQAVAGEDYRYIYRHTANSREIPAGVHEAYDIAHELGKGSFATVMKAVHRATGVWYAVKMIKSATILGGANSTRLLGTEFDSSLIAPESPAQAFAREISIMETLDHDNICRLKESFWGITTIDLVLEYIDGGDLLNTIIKGDGLGERMVQYLTYQICDAMQYIHGKGIAHRDLKPENILLTSADPPVIKIADFGLAKAADSFTMLKTMCGTPSYLAPEVVLQKGTSGYDHLVDSWSVGVIVFSMITATGPFVEDENVEIRERVRIREIDWPSLEDYRLCQAGFDFIGALMQFDPLCRMSLAEAWRHRWLVPARPAPTEDREQTEPLHDDDSDMVTEPSGSFTTPVAEPLNLEGYDESVPRGYMSRYYLEGSRHPDRRCFGAEALVRPALDLVPMAIAAPPAAAAPRSKPKTKRLRSELSDVQELTGTILKDECMNNVVRKKGKAASAPAVRGAKKIIGSMGPPPVPVMKPGRKEDEMEQDAPTPRRSARNAGKPPVNLKE